MASPVLFHPEIYTGEYEETMGRSWHRSTNLKAFFTKASCPKVFLQCIEMFEKLVQPQDRNSLAAYSHTSSDDLDLDDMGDGHRMFGGIDFVVTPEISEAVRQQTSSNLIIPKQAISITHIRHHQTAYSVSKRHEGNSGVLFQGSDTPFCIEQILQFPSNEGRDVLQGTWIVARRHQRAWCRSDPFMKYKHLRMRLWSCSLDPTLEARPIDRIDAHFAKRVIPWEGKDVSVVVSLSRVRL
jgi:hypothetical protein